MREGMMCTGWDGADYSFWRRLKRAEEEGLGPYSFLIELLADNSTAPSCPNMVTSGSQRWFQTKHQHQGLKMQNQNQWMIS